MLSTRDAFANIVSFPVHSKSVSLAFKALLLSLAMISPSSFTSLTAQSLLVLVSFNERRLMSNVAVTLLPSKFLAAAAFGVNVTVPASLPASTFVPYVISNNWLITTEPNLTCAVALASETNSILVVVVSSS